jgi:hypothetical protein
LESFGAAGDGRTDDTAAFTRALAWQRSAPGQTSLIARPAAVYRLRGPLTFDYDHGGIVCPAGKAVLLFDADQGNGIEVWDPSSGTRHVSGSYFRGIHAVHQGRTSGHAWYYRRARFGHINEDCGASGGWDHAFHYDNSCFGNNILLRPHLEMSGQGGTGIWIGPVCNGLHVVHPEINNPREVGIEIDARRTSDNGQGPGVNNVVLDHPMTHDCGVAHLRLSGAYATTIRAPRLEAGSSTAPLVVVGEHAPCRNLSLEEGWLQGSQTARTGISILGVAGFTIRQTSFQNIAGPAVRFPEGQSGARSHGVVLVHPIRAGTTGNLLEHPDGAGVTVIDTSGDVLVSDANRGPVLRDRSTGHLYRLFIRDGRLGGERVQRDQF